MKVLSALLCIIYTVKSWSQSVFPLPAPIIKEGDSLYQEYYSDEFYSAFTRKTYKDTLGAKFRFRSATNGEPFFHGYLIISRNDLVLQKMTILDNKIEGIGILYQEARYPNTFSYPYCQALFKNGVLEGPASLFGSNGEIIEVLLYRKGQYVKNLYHKNAFSRNSLKHSNKYNIDPLKRQKFILDEEY